MKTIERGEVYGGQLTRNLNQIIKEDYFSTQKVLREIFIPDYKPQQFDSILPAISWIKLSRKNLDRFFETRFTNSGLNNLHENIPVSFSVNSPAFCGDLKYLVSDKWDKLSNFSYKIGKSDDYMGEQLFRIYWHRLVERYKFISGRPT